MSIEDQIDRLCTAIEENTKALKGKSGGKAADDDDDKPRRGRPAGSKNKTKDDDDDDLNVGDDDNDDDSSGDEDDEGSDGPDVDAVRELLVKVRKNVGVDAVKDILKAVKCKSFDLVKEEDLPRVEKLAKKALGK